MRTPSRTDWHAALQYALSGPGQEVRDPMDAKPVFDWNEWRTTEWCARQAFARLGIVLKDDVEYFKRQPTCGGYATVGDDDKDVIALNPRVRDKVSVVAHEIGHVLMGHTRQAGPDLIEVLFGIAKRPVGNEVQAEGVALLVAWTLGLDQCVATTRSYIQHWMSADNADMDTLPKSWDTVFSVAERILAAGAGSYPPPTKGVIPPVRVPVIDVARFASRLRDGRAGR